MAPHSEATKTSSLIAVSEAGVEAEETPRPPDKRGDSPPEHSLQPAKKEYKWRILWEYVIAYIYATFMANIYGLYLACTVARWETLILTFLYHSMGILGTTAGAHRLWSHKSYTADWRMRSMLCIFQTISVQNPIFNWARDHRIHHKFVDTDADPYNAKRGLIFSHFGWLLIEKHPEVRKKGALIDMSDLRKDEIVMFQKRHYMLLITLISFVLPTVLPLLWGETLSVAWHVNIFRYFFTGNCVMLINSTAHKYGYKPYDRRITPTNLLPMSLMVYGDGWHNYHHAFPVDYKGSEFGTNRLDFTTAFIEFFAYIGWVSDLKTASAAVVRKRAARTGDDSRVVNQEEIL